MKDKEEIDIYDLESTLRRELGKIARDAGQAAGAIADSASKKMVAKLRQGKKHGGRTPEKTGVYASSWEDTPEIYRGAKLHTIRNRLKPQLTHLLEYGHSGAPGQSHIRPALRETLEEIDEEIKKM